MSDVPYRAKGRWVHVGWTATNVTWSHMQRGGLRGVRFQWRSQVRPGFYPLLAHFLHPESVLDFVAHAIEKHHDLTIKAFASSARYRDEWLMRKETELWCLLRRG